MKLNVGSFLFVFLCWTHVQSVYVVLRPREKKCFVDDVPAGIVSSFQS